MATRQGQTLAKGKITLPAEGSLWRHRAARVVADSLWWLGPVIFLLWLYADGLECWFIAVDFAWLGLLRRGHRASGPLPAVFFPAARGAVRPAGAVEFFLAISSLPAADGFSLSLSCVVSTTVT